jgi:hypothetical protein
MNSSSGAPSVDRAELIKWHDALEELFTGDDLDAGFQLVRCCQHPDAQWLASLFPSDEDVVQEHMWEVLRRLDNDPRAMLVAWLVGSQEDDWDEELKDRAAERGYAPAQAVVAADRFSARDEAQGFFWAQLAAAQQDRRALYMLGKCCRDGRGCVRDLGKAIEFFRSAAELECPKAQWTLAELAYGALDWQRYHWMGRAAQKRGDMMPCCDAVLSLLPSFERGENARILHTVAQALRPSLNVAKRTLSGRKCVAGFVASLKQVVELGEAMLGRARRAIACWAVAARRLGLVKDMRVTISKMAWEEPWRWGELDAQEIERRTTRIRLNITL